MIKHYRCPSSEAGQEGFAVVHAMMAQRAGNLPFSGGSLEQGAKLCSLIDIAASEMSRLDEERSAKQAARGKR